MSDMDNVAEIAEIADAQTDNPNDKGRTLPEWTHTYPEYQRQFLAEWGRDESKDPLAKEFNQEVLDWGANCWKSRTMMEVTWEWLVEDFPSSDELQERFIQPFLDRRPISSTTGMNKIKKWTKAYPRAARLFLSLFGVNEDTWEGAVHFNRALLYGAMLSPNGRTFAQGYMMLWDYYWREYRPKELSRREVTPSKRAKFGEPENDNVDNEAA